MKMRCYTLLHSPPKGRPGSFNAVVGDEGEGKPEASAAWRPCRTRPSKPWRRRKWCRVYRIPHSLDPNQSIGSINPGETDYEVGLLDEVEAGGIFHWPSTAAEVGFRPCTRS